MATAQQVQNFITTLGNLARSEVKRRIAAGQKWSLPSVCIAQAALETGWGTSSLMTKANAYFGIKAGSGWTGKIYSSRTQECYDGLNYTTITDAFRAYDSLAESVKDYFDLITGLSRYAAACGTTDPRACITAIKNGGYATAPDYITNVMSIINKNDLTKYDDVSGGSDPAPDPGVKSIEAVAKEVIAGLWGNNPERSAKLASAGYNAAEVQNKVNELLKSHKKVTPTKSITDIAREVIAGKWGNNPQRAEKLKAAGYDPNAVQNKVNELMNSGSSNKKSVETVAREVIAGKWGNNPERKRKLEAAGYNYTEVQTMVNRLM